LATKEPRRSWVRVTASAVIPNGVTLTNSA